MSPVKDIINIFEKSLEYLHLNQLEQAGPEGWKVEAVNTCSMFKLEKVSASVAQLTIEENFDKGKAATEDDHPKK